MCTERYHFVAFGCMKIPNFVRDRRTTMTVSVTQEQMRQNSFHHTLTVPLSSALVALRGRTEEPSLCLLKGGEQRDGSEDRGRFFCLGFLPHHK